MQIYCIYFIIVTIFSFYTKPAIGKKLLFKRNSVSRNDEDWDEASESFGRGTSVKRQQPFDDNRRLNKALEFDDPRDEPMDLYGDKRNRKRSPFGVVYSGGQPIGVIEPLYQSYQLKNFDDAGHSYKKRDLNEPFENDVMGESNPYQNNANLHGGKYAAVLASFKIDSRLKSDAYKNDDAVSIEKRREKNRITKRDPPQNESPAKDLSKPSNFVETRAAKVKRDAIDLEKIERNIINVMDDLGLADAASKNIHKRSALETLREKRDIDEDEDLENGPNKITMTKENLDRSKKDNITPNLENTLRIDDGLKSATAKTKRSNTTKILNYQHEGEEYIRNRRHNSNAETVVQDLENSGELTVSGNKSPLISLNSEQNYSDNKRAVNDLTAETNTDIQKRNNDYSDYEKTLEKNIQNKIIAIKADVKRELNILKENERLKRNANLMNNKSIIKRDLGNMAKANRIDNNKIAENLRNEQSGGVGGVRERRNVSIVDSFRRISREIDDDLAYNDKYGADEVEVPTKRESKNYDDEEAVDVSVERNKPTYYADIMKRRDLSNNSLATIQTAQIANLPSIGNVLPAPVGASVVVAPLVQPMNQLQASPQQQQQIQPQLQQQPPQQQQQQQQQQPVNMAQQSSDQLPVNSFAANGVQQANAVPQAAQMYNAPFVANQSQFNGMFNQGNADLAQKPQIHTPQDINSANIYRQVNVSSNKPMRRQNLVNDYDQDGFDEKVDELRSTDLDSDDDGSVRFEKDIADNDSPDEEDESDNEKNLVRQERFLQNITEEELRNLENENPSFEQRKRREAADFQYDDYDGDYSYNMDSGGALNIPKRSKRAQYNTYGDTGEDVYGDIDSDDLEEPLRQRVYRKRNLDFNRDYEMDSRNNYKNNDKRKRRNNNEPNYFDNLDVDTFDAVPDYEAVEDYRRRKRQALKTASSDGLMNYNKKLYSNERNSRKKRLGGKANRKLAKDINMEALSHSELFGGLPQTFQGELSRFKRVKRSNDY